MLKQFIDVEVDDEFKREAYPVMANWSYLSMHLASKDPSAKDIGKLIRVELDSKRRPQVLYRLMQRLGSRVRERLHKEMEDILNEREERGEVPVSTTEEVGSPDKKADKPNRRSRPDNLMAVQKDKSVG